MLQGSIIEQGLLQRQGDLTVIEGIFSAPKRRVFLFENIIIIAKKNKPSSKGGNETFAYKESYKVHILVNGIHGYVVVQTNEFGLRETITGHPTRFELYRKKHTIVFQVSVHH